MDDTSNLSQPGGHIVPGNLGDIAMASVRRRAGSGLRYELRDPFAEVTFRTTNLNDIIARAERLGSDRFTEIDSAEQHTTMRKVDGQWQRGAQRPAPQPRALVPLTERDEVPDRPLADAPPGPTAAAARGEPAGVPAVVPDATRADAQADRAALEHRLNIELADRYVIKQGSLRWGGANLTEYRFRGNLERVAFTEARYRLATDTNNPSVARSMVDVAQARQWRGLRVSGHDDFRRLVWLEASVRGINAMGYEPAPGDIELLHKERAARMVNRIEPAAQLNNEATREGQPSVPAAKASARGSGGRKTVLAAIEAVLVAQRVPEKRREAIMAAAADNLARRLAAGEVHKVKVLDRSAPKQPPLVRPLPEPQRTRERPTQVR